MQLPKDFENANAFGVIQTPALANLFHDIQYRKGENHRHLESRLYKLFMEFRQNKASQQMKYRAFEIVESILTKEMPGSYLQMRGSSVTNLDSSDSNLDLCLLVRESESHDYETSLSYEYLFEAKRILKDNSSVFSAELITATVPVLKVKLKFPFNHFVVNIVCNYLEGLRNSHLLFYFTKIDERFQQMALILRDDVKNTWVIDSGEEHLNSYGLMLMIVHYLQCAVNPPILPNLLKLFPLYFDNPSLDPRLLRSDLDLHIPDIPKNERSLLDLLYGFYNYYAYFNYEKYGISIRNACVFDRSQHTICTQDYNFFLEEPYHLRTIAMSKLKSVQTYMTETFHFLMEKLRIPHNLTVDELNGQVEIVEKEKFVRIAKLKALEKLLRITGERKIGTIRCFGLGKVSSLMNTNQTTGPAIQLIVLLAIMEHFRPHTVTAQDPDFFPIDMQYLNSKNIQTPEATDMLDPVAKPAPGQENELTLLYIIHGAASMYNNILSTYWELDQLKNVILIGNKYPEINDPKYWYSEYIRQYYTITESEDILTPELMKNDRLMSAFCFISIFHLKPTCDRLPEVNCQLRTLNGLKIRKKKTPGAK